MREDVKQHVTSSLIQTSLRGVDSHGIELLPHYLRALEGGRINPNPDYRFERQEGSVVGLLDADHTFGHAAGAEAMLRASRMAEEAGVGVAPVCNSTHFGAAAYFSLLAAERGQIGLCCTHSTPHMLTHGGTRCFFSTNPICFAAPCANEEPYCLDMATSLSTWNRVMMYEADGREIPTTWGCDEGGNATSDPSKVASLLAIGDYKGFGLSMMVDVLCSLLTGMPYGSDISRMYGVPLGQKRMLGHFFLVLNVAHFQEIDVFKARMQEMMDRVRAEPVKDPDVPIMVAGDPEKAAAKIRTDQGIPLTEKAFSELVRIGDEVGVKLG